MTSSRASLDAYTTFVRNLGDREYFGMKLGLDKVRLALDRLGNPQQKFSSIHVAGTNGKGSVCAMLASILKESGLRVGLYTSPHLQDFCERIRVSGVPITHEEVMQQERKILEVEEEDPLTFFEMATVIGFLHFAQAEVDMAIIETGLGGRLDATNIITPLVSVITSIGLDHTQHLGSTLEAIAGEKAGIIKRGVPVVIGQLPPEAEKVVRERAELMGSSFIKSPHPPFYKGGQGGISPSLQGDHQKQNAAIALTTLSLAFSSTHPVAMGEGAVERGLKNLHWPGRLETVSTQPWILLDAAHNPQAIEVVRQFLEKELHGRRLVVLMGAMKDKDLEGMIRQISPLTEEFIFTAAPLKRAVSPDILQTIASGLGKKSFLFPTVASALEATQKKLDASNDVLLITGSFSIVGEAQKCFGIKIS